MNVTSIKRRAVIGGTGFCLAGAAAFASPHLFTDTAEAVSEPVRFSAFHETYASSTPVDWATNADHVVRVTATEESRGRTEGATVERIVTLKVDDLYWSSPAAPELSTTFEMPAFGWINGQEVVMNDTSRLEPGHQYLVGLIFRGPRCSDGDVPDPGGWSVIGSGGIIPVDDGVGRGEIEGFPDQEVVGEDGSMFAAAMSGPKIEQMVSLVASAAPEKRLEQPGVRAAC